MAGKQKMGVELEIVGQVGEESSKERSEYVLVMRQFKATVKGKPEDPMEGDDYLSRQIVCPQPVQGVTQYQQWRWAVPDDLREAADAGSLCSQMFLSTLR